MKKHTPPLTRDDAQSPEQVTQARPFAPSQFARRILFVVTGTSPAVVTESLYALAIQQEDIFVPTEIHIMTTSTGATAATKALLDGGVGAFHRMVDEYPILKSIKFTENHITVIRDQAGRVLADISSLQENQDAGDSIMDAVRRFTLDDHSALHVSLAGGRKTMGFFAGYALSLFARPQDRLSHVLVPNGVERARDFYYPSAYGKEIALDDGTTVLPRDVEVLLAEIPLVRLRHGIPGALISGAATWSSVIDAAQRVLGAPKLEIDIAQGSVRCADQTVELQPVQLALYLWLAQRIVAGMGADHTIGRETTSDGFLACYRSVCSGDLADVQRVENSLEATLKSETLVAWAKEKKSRINKKLRNTLGPELCKPYLIRSFGKRPNTHYGLDIGRHDIGIVPAALAVTIALASR